MNEIINTADALAGKSPWAWVLTSFVGWIVATSFIVRYMITKRDETADRLLTSERDKVDLLMKVQHEKEAIHKEYHMHNEQLVRDMITVQHEMVTALNKLTDEVKRK
jgi:hypothetical protein